MCHTIPDEALPEERLEMRYEKRGRADGESLARVPGLSHSGEEDGGTGGVKDREGREGDRAWRRQQRKRSGACVA